MVSATWVLVMSVLPFEGPTHATCAACGTRWQVGDLPLMGDKTANRSELKRRFPGHIATGLVILTTSFWTLWSMPTTDEIVRSLGRHGENAGRTCARRIGKRRLQDCPGQRDAVVGAGLVADLLLVGRRVR